MHLFLVLISVISLFAGDEEKYGKELTMDKKTNISEILADPEKYEGKRVLVEGTIVGVCATRGCWIDLASDKGYDKIKVKVNDGEIVFPMEAKGKVALVEGEVYSFVPEMTEEEHERSEKLEKESGCENAESDSGCCAGSTKMTKIYQIKGIGAVIKS